MLKDFMKGLKGIVVGAIEEVGTEDMPPKVKHAAEDLLHREYAKKLHALYMDDKLTDEQHKKAAEIFGCTTKSLKALIAEIEGAPEKKAEEPKEAPKFKVGQRVQFKTWDEMEKEYGLDCDGDIGGGCAFVTGMKPLCGTYATIVSINKDGIGVQLGEFSSDAPHYWSFTTKMIKAVE